MVSRVLLATSKVLMIDPRLRAAIHRSGCGFSHWRPKLVRLSSLLKWLSLYGVLVSLLVVTFAVVPLLGLMLLGVFLYRSSRRQAHDDEYGTATWATLRDLAWRGFLYATSGLVVGRVLDGTGNGPKLALDVLRHYPWWQSAQANRISQGLWLGTAKRAPIILPDHEIIHAAVYGRSGSGKSWSHCIPNLLIDWRSACVVTDSKFELAEATARYRRETFGREGVCIAPFGGAPEGFAEHAFNPFSVVNLKSPHLISEAIHYAKALVRPEKNDHNPFFVKSAILVLDAILSFLFCHATPSDCTLTKMREIASNPEALRAMTELMLQSNIAGGYLKSKARQLQALTGKTLMDVLATLNTQLFWIDSPAIAHATSWTTFEFRKLLDGNLDFYLLLPVDRSEDYSPLIRTIITGISHAIFSAGPSADRSIRFYFDEASLLGQEMPVLERILTKGRAFGMKSCWYFQSVHQIQEVFPEHQAQVFREQMSVEQFLEIANYQTAQEVSQWAGQKTVRVWNESFNTGWSQSETNALHPSWTHGTSGGATTGYQKAGRALIRPEELLQLPSDVTVVLKPGCPPILARKLKAYLKMDWSELASIPFGRSSDSTEASILRWLLAGVLVIVLGFVLLTHPKEAGQLRQQLAAVWDKPKPRNTTPTAVRDTHPKTTSPQQKAALKKKQTPQKSQRRRPPPVYDYDEYGY